jgi:hypothetical protein
MLISRIMDIDQLFTVHKVFKLALNVKHLFERHIVYFDIADLSTFSLRCI